MEILGIDTGGTFTDVVCLHPQGRLRTLKLPTTGRRPDEGIMAAIEELGELKRFRCVHGTTVATNALLERRGARTALITTRGFADVLTLGRGQRDQLYALRPVRAPVLVEHHLCFEVDERISVDGQVLIPLDPSCLESVAQALRAHQVEAVALCLLFSHLDPGHEILAQQALRDYGWEGGVFLSHRLCPEDREFERASTTAVSAYLSRSLQQYLLPLQEKVGRRGCLSLDVVHSGGAKISVEEACHNPAGCVLSGPAAGVRGALEVAREAWNGELKRFLCFDMGGTSTDVAVCHEGLPYLSETRVDNFPIRQLSVDIHTVGAGGESIIRLDAAGGLVVGPQSVGAQPGPAACGRGLQPCVTDANLVLGRLPLELAGGRVKLRPELSRQALSPLAARLGMSIEETAAGALAVVRASMERALRRVSLERGHDPRDFTLLAYGGAGPLHAAELAELLGCGRILIPRYPGLLCALGAALSPWQRQFSRSLHLPLEDLSAERLKIWREELRTEARRAYRSREGKLFFREQLDLRYRGQGQTLAAPVRLRSAGAHFEKQHRRLFGYNRQPSDIEAVTLRVRAQGPSPIWRMEDVSPTGMPSLEERTQIIYWGSPLRPVAAPFFIDSG